MLFTSLLVGFASLACAQAPNTVSTIYPNLATMASNGTFFVVPVPDAALKELITPYDLLPVPASDPTLYPHGYPAGTHPVVVYSSYNSDIKQTIAGVPAYIERLVNSQVIVPYIDRLGDKKTPFSKTIVGFIGGANGQNLQGVVPAIVATAASAGGYKLFVSTFDPDTAPWTPLPNGENSIVTKEILVPNPISGPGVYPSAVDLLFKTTNDPQAKPQLLKELLNQPAILPTGQCQYNAFWFNETFSNPIEREGSVTLYSPAVPQQLTGQAGPEASKVYSGAGVGAFSATGEQIGFNPEACQAAAARAVVV